MTLPVNKPGVLAVGTPTCVSVTLNTVPPQGLFYGTGVGPLSLTLNDSATFAGATAGNQIWTMPLSAMTRRMEGFAIPISNTSSNGLVVSAVPPGVSCTVTF